MQSFRQHRRFGENVRAQYERNRHRFEESEKGTASITPEGFTNSDNSTTLPSTNTASTDSPETPSQSSSKTAVPLGGREPDLEKTGSATDDAHLQNRIIDRDGDTAHLDDAATDFDAHTRQAEKDIPPTRDNEDGRGRQYEEIRTATGSQRPVTRSRTASRVGSVLSRVGTRMHLTMTGVDLKTRTKENDHVFVVGYEGPDDELNPHNWSRWTRGLAT
jgi:hypothetical protein